DAPLPAAEAGRGEQLVDLGHRLGQAGGVALEVVRRGLGDRFGQVPVGDHAGRVVAQHGNDRVPVGVHQPPGTGGAHAVDVLGEDHPQPDRVQARRVQLQRALDLGTPAVVVLGHADRLEAGAGLEGVDVDVVADDLVPAAVVAPEPEGSPAGVA